MFIIKKKNFEGLKTTIGNKVLTVHNELIKKIILEYFNLDSKDYIVVTEEND